MGRRGNHSLVLGRSDHHGIGGTRDGFLRVVDAHLVKGGTMREAIIISAILIIAIWLWMPRKGGKT